MDKMHKHRAAAIRAQQSAQRGDDIGQPLLGTLLPGVGPELFEQPVAGGKTLGTAQQRFEQSECRGRILTAHFCHRQRGHLPIVGINPLDLKASQRMNAQLGGLFCGKIGKSRGSIMWFHRILLQMIHFVCIQPSLIESVHPCSLV